MGRFLGVTVILLCATSAQAILVPGLTVAELTAPEFAESTVLTVTTNPSGQIVMSDGRSLLTFVTEGQPLVREGLRQMDGGPIGNYSVTTSIAYDAMGRIYINDFGAGEIYRRDGIGPWEKYAEVNWPDDMHFDASGNLLVASRVDHTTTDLVSFDASGSGTPLATELGRFESFTLDSMGSIIFPEIGGDLYRVSPLGQVDFLGVGTAGPGRFGPNVNVESIALTPGGNILLGVNTGASEELGVGNTNRLDRFDPVLGESVALGIDFTGFGNVGFRLPVDMFFDANSDRLLIASFGSIQPLAVSGDFDIETDGLIIPEPSTLLLCILALAVVGGWRKQRG